ncbi:hypothetical protein PCE1_003704 [Barthelona sp. PCE]
MGRSKDRRDIFYRKAKEEGYRARSAFKLLQIDNEFDILSGVTRAVDLCAAPGSWSQVLAQRVNPTAAEGRLVAVDLNEIADIDGVTFLQGDITQVSTAESIIELFSGELADLVVCDGAPDVSGLHDLDEYIQAQLVLAAFNIASFLLRCGGTFLTKVFRASHSNLLVQQMKIFFDKVLYTKPTSSRASSAEAFLLCQGFRPPSWYVPDLTLSPSHLPEDFDVWSNDDPRKRFIPFVACGDVSGWDSMKSFQLEMEEMVLQPVAEPINPPYAEAIRQENLRKVQRVSEDD